MSLARLTSWVEGSSHDLNGQVNDSPAGGNKNSNIPSDHLLLEIKLKSRGSRKKNNPYSPGKGFVRVKLAMAPDMLIFRRMVTGELFLAYQPAGAAPDSTVSLVTDQDEKWCFWLMLP